MKLKQTLKNLLKKNILSILYKGNVLDKEDLKEQKMYWLVPNMLNDYPELILCTKIKNRLFYYTLDNYDAFANIYEIKNDLFLNKEDAIKEMCKRISNGEMHFLKEEILNKFEKEYPEYFI